MGVDTRRPPLPAPTDTTSLDEASPVATEVATNVTTRTDKTSYTIPEDGSPIIISTHKKESRIGSHGRQKSQTSLLIEYFEGSKTGDKTKGRPSVRVKVTPSSRKSSSRKANDAVQITSIGSDRKPSYTRRISLGSKTVETGAGTTELSHSSDSNLSGPPVEIELLNNGSDLSRSSRGLIIAANESNVSSMPPDSLLDDHAGRGLDHIDDDDTINNDTYLAAPQRRRSRSTSRERITQKVMEKLGQSPMKHRQIEKHEAHEKRRRSSKAQYDDDRVSGAESSLLSSNPASSHRSYQSNASQTSRVTNNAKLLEKVEDTIKRILLPEITAIRDDQRAERKLRTFDSSRRGSDYEHSLERRVSKSSSSPNIKSKPKVVLNREGDDPGTVLSRGDSEYQKTRKTSGERSSTRRSSAHRKSDGYEEEVRHRSSKGDLGIMAAAGLTGAALTSAALKHHDSADSDVHHRRRRRSKSRSSRSRSNSIADGVEEAYTRKEAIPPMPMSSHINDSDLTRTSLLSAENEQPDEHRMLVKNTRTPVREVSRGSVDAAMSPVSSRTPTRTPLGKSVGMSHGNRSIESPSPINTKTAVLSAGAEAISRERHVDADGYGRSTPKAGTHSPAQSVSSLRMQYEDPLVPAGLRPRSAASRTSAERSNKRSAANSGTSSPVTRHALSRELTDEFVTPMEFGHQQLTRERSQTPSGEDVDEWFKREHLQNEQYRNSLDTAANRASYQTNPYPEDEKRFAEFERQSRGDDTVEKDIQGVGANPEYVHTPVGVESAVASLIEPSTLSSAQPLSYSDSSAKATYSDRVANQLQFNGKDNVAMYEGSTLSQTIPSDDRWAALKRQANSLSNASSTNVDESPRQSPVKSLHGESPIKMVHSGLPLADDPLPEIGVYDDTKSEVSTNPSIIKGPLSGDVTGQSVWPYTPSPRLAESRSREAASGYSRDALLAGAVAGGAAAAALAAKRHATARDVDEHHDERKITPQLRSYHEEPLDRNATPTQNSPGGLRDEGYVTDVGARTPKAEQEYSREDINDYHRAMDKVSVHDKDPFVADPRHVRNLSGNSHGMASPLYDSATGKGMENIRSKDIVALMDHLTVRDSQRNARDTEILISLVRNAAEMRQNFEDMKRFIYEQDELIMTNTKRGQDVVVQKVLSGPRPQPLGSPRTPRKHSEEDIQVKRRGLLRRALKGLTSGKNTGDLANIENMLVQVLENVEQLKHQGIGSQEMSTSYIDEGMTSYEKLRAVPDPGYEADGAAGTDSTPSQSGHFTTPTRAEKQVFHSGYNGRPGSENRVSTVMEGDEDEDLAPHERTVLAHQFENNERLLTPTQHFRPDLATSPTGLGSPVDGKHNDMTPRAVEKQQKHKSNSSSIFGVPKMSRWSKTTTSSAVPESPVVAKNARPISAASRSGSSLREYDDDDDYSLQEDDRLRSTQSLAKDQAKAETRSVRSQRSRVTRTPSPLIPSEASCSQSERDRGVSPVQHDDYDPERDFDDPKYRAIRNSILLQHPQPRQASTNRHQTHLESKAHNYDEDMTESDVSQRSGSDFDPSQWGSKGVGALNRTRFSQSEPLSPVSMASPYTGRQADNGPLVPSTSQPHPTHYEHDDYDDDEEDDEEDDHEPQYSNSGFARSNGPWYSSPLGSGHLLEPIAEVRYSLETDSGHISPEPQIASARAVTARKITGPRPMGSRSTSAAKPKELETSGTVRRKPIPGNRVSHETLNSQESETF